jgi:hypothetical protein
MAILPDLSSSILAQVLGTIAGSKDNQGTEGSKGSKGKH